MTEEKRTVTLIHGWGSHPDVWKPLRDRLTNPTTAASFKAVSAPSDLPAVIREAAPSSPSVMIGWSLGGMMAIEFARVYPERVAGLVLFGTPLRFVAADRAWGWPERVLLRMIRRLNSNSETVRRDFIEQMFTPDEHRTGLRDRYAAFTGDESDFGVAGLGAGLHYLISEDHRDTIADVRCPVLWIHGECDPICPITAFRAIRRRALTKHHFVRIQHAGHVPFLSRPEKCSAVVKAFIQRRINGG